MRRSSHRFGESKSWIGKHVFNKHDMSTVKEFKSKSIKTNVTTLVLEIT